MDVSHYRSILKNKAIVDEAEKILKDFKAVSYDVNAHVKAIEVFEAKAVRPHPMFKCTPFFNVYDYFCRLRMQRLQKRRSKRS